MSAHLQADHAVVTGRRHRLAAQVCQDYACSAVQPGFAYAIVADGCSGAGRTDLGARAWVLAAASVLAQEGAAALVSAEYFLARAARALAPWATQLPVADLFATLLVAVATPDEASVLVLGDGCVLAKHADGTVEVVQVSFAGDAPDYPVYALLPEGYQRWQALADNALCITRQPAGPAGPEGLLALPPQRLLRLSRAELALQALAVATDGLASRPGTSLLATAHTVLDFQSTAGAFVQRRLGRRAAAWVREESEPGDDLALGVLWLGEPGDAAA